MPLWRRRDCETIEGRRIAVPCIQGRHDWWADMSDAGKHTRNTCTRPGDLHRAFC